MFSFQEAFGSPMVVNDLHSLSATVIPHENDAPLVVDSDSVKSLKVSRKRLKPVTWRRPQGIQGNRGV